MRLGRGEKTTLSFIRRSLSDMAVKWRDLFLGAAATAAILLPQIFWCLNTIHSGSPVHLRRAWGVICTICPASWSLTRLRL